MFSCISKETNPVSTQNLSSNWTIFSSENLSVDGGDISQTGFNDSDWVQTTVPNTVLGALVQAGKYPDIFMGDNFDKIDTAQFRHPWWYRTEFNVENTDKISHIVFNGINYKANIFLNGKQIANSGEIETAFKQFKIDVSEYIVKGKNALAVEIIPPVKGDLTIGFVDWNPTPSDRNMGIWREVILQQTGNTIIDGLLVETNLDTNSLLEARIGISVWFENKGDKTEVELLASFDSINIRKSVLLEKGERRKVTLDANEFGELLIKNPRIWWPNGLGKAELYNLSVQLSQNGQISDEKQTRFGIRKVEQYLNEEGHKAFKINGKRIIVKGAGWVDDILLADSDQKVKDQLSYVKQMNMNTVRLEGFWGRNSTIYDTCDELGLLIMIGWSCQWEWEGYCGRKESEFMCIYTPEDEDLHAAGFRDQVKWLRNHPSIFLWVYGSDKLPSPTLEEKLNKLVLEEDHTRPILASCKGHDFGTDFWNISKISGPTGVKMLGPYGYVTPNYWYEDTQIGGAYGFNTETGPGPQVPPIESIRRMIPEKDLWPMNEMWNYHSGRNEFQTLDRFMKAFNARYGEAQSVEEFAQYCQLSNYEAIRPMFEAFAVNKFNSTGVIQWMLNSAWPELYWQQYDWYLMPNGAFYGTQNACQTLNIIYNYKEHNIYITSELFDDQKDLKAEVRLLNFNSEVIFTSDLQITAKENSSARILDLPALPQSDKAYFLDLKLKTNSGETIADNFYWLSSQKDVCDFKNSQWFITPNSQYANFKSLKKLSQVKIESSFEIKEVADNFEITVKLHNPEQNLAFFIEMQVLNKTTGMTILPVLWSDNYVSLLAGESKTYTAIIRKDKLSKDQIEFTYSGINLKK